MQVWVEAVGVLAPGMPDWDHARGVLSGLSAFAHGQLTPAMPASLPPAERRRASSTVRLAVAVAEQALQQTTIAPHDMASVFSSYEGAGEITHQLCEALAGRREISPTQFENSVHNSPSGYFSIAMGAKLAGISVCRGKWSFAAGLLAAVAQVSVDAVPILYVCYDSPLPEPLRDVMPIAEPTAIALVLTPRPTDRTLASWNISLQPGTDSVDWPAWLPASWHANASARGFAALSSLTDRARDVCLLPLSPELNVQVTLC
jgi:hypothetical protein